MAVRNMDDLNILADDALESFLLEKMPREILIGLLKQKITAGQVNISDVIQELIGDDETVVVVMRKR